MAMHETKTLIAIYRTGNVEIKSHIALCTPCLLIHNDDDCFKYLLWDTRLATLQTPWANLKLARILPFACAASSLIWIISSGWWNTLAHKIMSIAFLSLCLGMLESLLFEYHWQTLKLIRTLPFAWTACSSNFAIDYIT